MSTTLHSQVDQIFTKDVFVMYQLYVCDCWNERDDDQRRIYVEHLARIAYGDWSERDVLELVDYVKEARLHEEHPKDL